MNDAGTTGYAKKMKLDTSLTPYTHTYKKMTREIHNSLEKRKGSGKLVSPEHLGFNTLYLNAP